MENKIPSISSLFKKKKTKKKTDYNTKISELENKLTDHNNEKYITTLEL